MNDVTQNWDFWPPLPCPVFICHDLMYCQKEYLPSAHYGEARHLWMALRDHSQMTSHYFGQFWPLPSVTLFCTKTLVLPSQIPWPSPWGVTSFMDYPLADKMYRLARRSIQLMPIFYQQAAFYNHFESFMHYLMYAYEIHELKTSSVNLWPISKTEVWGFLSFQVLQ